MSRVGIELEIRTYEWGTFYEDIKQGNFHLYSLAWVGVTDPDIYYNLFHSVSVPPNGDNRGRYNNPAIDALLEKGRVAIMMYSAYTILAGAVVPVCAPCR